MSTAQKPDDGKRPYGSGSVKAGRRLPDGRTVYRWRIRGTTPGGQHVQRAGTTRGTLTEAKRDMAAMRAAIEGGAAAVDGRSITVAQLLDNWLAVKAGEVSEKTLRINRDLARLHIVPRIGAMKVKALTAGRLQQFHLDLAAETPLERAREQIHGLLKQSLDHAVVLGVLQYNPERAVRVPKAAPPKRLRLEDEGEVMAWTLDEASALCDAALTAGTPRLLITALGIMTGLRPGELLGLRWADIDLNARPDAPHGLLSVRQVAVRRLQQGMAITTPKTRASRRTLRLNAAGRELVDAAARWKDKRSALDGWKDSGMVFPTDYGDVLDPNRVRHSLARLCAELDIPAHHPYTARHSFASLSYAAGVPVAEISRALGHVGSEITMRVYVHLFDRTAPLADLITVQPGRRYAIPPSDETRARDDADARRAMLADLRSELVSGPYPAGY